MMKKYYLVYYGNGKIAATLSGSPKQTNKFIRVFESEGFEINEVCKERYDKETYYDEY